MTSPTPTPGPQTGAVEAAEQWATIAFALARDLNRIKRICTQEHPPKMASPTKDWEPGTETRHSDGTRCVLLEDRDYALLPAATSPQESK